MLELHERIDTVLLPKRSPEDNPVEDLWRQLKNQVAANLERSLDALREACRRFFDELAPEEAHKMASLAQHFFVILALANLFLLTTPCVLFAEANSIRWPYFYRTIRGFIP